LISLLQNIISETLVNRDLWDASDDGKLQKTLKPTLANASKSERDTQDVDNNIAMVAGQKQETQQDTHVVDKTKLRTLEDFCIREFVAKLEEAQHLLSDQQLKPKTMRTLKVRAQGSIETNMSNI
jgi:hypothetical protein